MDNEIIKILVNYTRDNSESLNEWLEIINEIQTKAKQYLDKIYRND
mgnify:CR=1 FL=1